MEVADVVSYLHRKCEKAEREQVPGEIIQSYHFKIYSDGSGGIYNDDDIEVTGWNDLDDMVERLKGPPDHSELIANLRQIADKLEQESSNV